MFKPKRIQYSTEKYFDKYIKVGKDFKHFCLNIPNILRELSLNFNKRCL